MNMRVAYLLPSELVFGQFYFGKVALANGAVKDVVAYSSQRHVWIVVGRVFASTGTRWLLLLLSSGCGLVCGCRVVWHIKEK